MSLLRIPSIVIASTPTLETTPDYTTGDLVGGKANELAKAVLERGGSAVLESLMVIDKEEQGIDMEIHLWGRNPTAGVSSADNAAYAVTDAELAASYLGYVAVTGSDYKDVGGQKVITYKSIGLIVRSILGRADLNPTGKSIWYNMVARGTMNFATAADLVLRFGFMQH